MKSATPKQVKQKLEENQYRCALTGWELGVETFCLDHIIPIQDGGGDEISNLQCVHPLANAAKGTMSNEQFIQLCHAVATHHSVVADT